LRNHDDYHNLIKTYRYDIYRMIRSRARSELDADDIFQEVLIKIYKGLEKFRRDSSLKTWIYTLVKNSVIDYYRQPWWSKIVFWKDMDQQDLVQNSSHDNNDPQKSFLERETAAQLSGYIETLPINEKEIFCLRYIDEFTLNEIAELKGKNLSTIKTHLYRAVKKIRKELEADR
jgi:RNA polymerase sigma-70 factor, ECF subfamily